VVRRNDIDSPLDITLSLSGFDLGLTLSVLFLSLGGEGGRCRGTAEGGVDLFGTASNDFFGGADDGVDLRRSSDQDCDTNRGRKSFVVRAEKKEGRRSGVKEVRGFIWSSRRIMI